LTPRGHGQTVINEIKDFFNKNLFRYRIQYTQRDRFFLSDGEMIYVDILGDLTKDYPLVFVFPGITADS
jgi:hypothetical protein